MPPFQNALLCAYFHKPLISLSGDTKRSLNTDILGIKAVDPGKIPYIY